MKTYWLLGEDKSRQRQRVERGIARIERTGSTRRRARHLDVKPMTPTFNLRCEDRGSPQLTGGQGLMVAGGSVRGDSTNTMSQSLSGSPCNSMMNCGLDSHSPGGGSLKFHSHSRPYSAVKTQYSNFLHPYSLLVGPTSHELMRRSSSRRRRLKFTIGGAPEEDERKEIDSLCGLDDNLDALEFTADALPTIVRGKEEEGYGVDVSGDGHQRPLGEDSFTASSTDCIYRSQKEKRRSPTSVSLGTSDSLRGARSSAFDYPCEIVRDQEPSSEISRTKSTEQAKFSHEYEQGVKDIKAPIVKIESFDCDSPRSLRAGHDAELISLPADDASDTHSSTHCDPQESCITCVMNEHQLDFPEYQFENCSKSPAAENSDCSHRVTRDESSPRKNTDMLNKSGTSMTNDFHNHGASSSCGNFERADPLSGSNTHQKMLKNSNGMMNFLPLQPIASNRVSPISERSDQFCGADLERKDKSTRKNRLNSCPVSEPTLPCFAHELDSPQQPGNVMCEAPAQTSKIRRSSNDQQQMSSELSDAVSLEMIPLLEDSRKVIECGFYKQDCDKDELV